jgi:hypothetical protein
MATGIEEARNKYDLIVIGIAREWSVNEATIAQTSELLTTTAVSINRRRKKERGEGGEINLIAKGIRFASTSENGRWKIKKNRPI